MRSVLKAGRAFRARHRPHRVRLLRTLAGHARAHGLRSALGRIQATAAVDSNRDAYVVWCETHTPDWVALERMRWSLPRGPCSRR